MLIYVILFFHLDAKYMFTDVNLAPCENEIQSSCKSYGSSRSHVSKNQPTNQTPNSEIQVKHSVILCLINIYYWVVNQFDIYKEDS